jgi:hypothetical protein
VSRRSRWRLRLAAHLGTSGPQPHLDLPGYVLNGLITVGLVASFRRVDAGRRRSRYYSPRHSLARVVAGLAVATIIVAGVHAYAIVLLLMLVDESGSLVKTDPSNQRVVGAKAALSELVERGTTGGDRGLQAQMDGFSTRNRGLDTDFAMALCGGQASLAARAAALSQDGSAPPCQAMVLFTDGNYDIQPRHVTRFHELVSLLGGGSDSRGDGSRTRRPFQIDRGLRCFNLLIDLGHEGVVARLRSPGSARPLVLDRPRRGSATLGSARAGYGWLSPTALTVAWRRSEPGQLTVLAAAGRCPSPWTPRGST